MSNIAVAAVSTKLVATVLANLDEMRDEVSQINMEAILQKDPSPEVVVAIFNSLQHLNENLTRARPSTGMLALLSVPW